VLSVRYTITYAKIPGIGNGREPPGKNMFGAIADDVIGAADRLRA